MQILNTSFSRMAFLAREYCDLVENMDGGARDSWLQRMSALLPQLHEAITRLHVPDASRVDTPVHDFDARFELFSRMYQRLGEREGYAVDVDLRRDGRRLSGSLAYDLTDIYFDLKSGLELLSAHPDQPNIAINEWHRTFHLHWRHHLKDAEKQLQAIGGGDHGD